MISQMTAKAAKSIWWRQVTLLVYFVLVAIPVIGWLVMGQELVDRFFPVLTDVEIVMRDLKRTDALVFRFSFNKEADCNSIDAAWYGIADDGRLERATVLEPVPPLTPRPLGPNLSTRHVIVLYNPNVKSFKGVFQYRCRAFGGLITISRTWIVGPFTNWTAPTSAVQRSAAPALSD